MHLVFFVVAYHVPTGLFRFTIPVLWDKKTQTIVNNESSEIIRMFNIAFNDFLSPSQASLDFYPENLRAEINELNEWIYPNINSKTTALGFRSQ